MSTPVYEEKREGEARGMQTQELETQEIPQDPRDSGGGEKGNVAIRKLVFKNKAKNAFFLKYPIKGVQRRRSDANCPRKLRGKCRIESPTTKGENRENWRV